MHLFVLSLSVCLSLCGAFLFLSCVLKELLACVVELDPVLSRFLPCQRRSAVADKTPASCKFEERGGEVWGVGVGEAGGRIWWWERGYAGGGGRVWGGQQEQQGAAAGNWGKDGKKGERVRGKGGREGEGGGEGRGNGGGGQCWDRDGDEHGAHE